MSRKCTACLLTLTSIKRIAAVILGTRLATITTFGFNMQMETGSFTDRLNYSNLRAPKPPARRPIDYTSMGRPPSKHVLTKDLATYFNDLYSTTLPPLPAEPIWVPLCEWVPPRCERQELDERLRELAVPSPPPVVAAKRALVDRCSLSSSTEELQSPLVKRRVVYRTGDLWNGIVDVYMNGKLTTISRSYRTSECGSMAKAKLATTEFIESFEQ